MRTLTSTATLRSAPDWWRAPLLRVVVTALVGTSVAYAAGVLAAGAAHHAPVDHPVVIEADLARIHTDVAFFHAVTGEWPSTMGEVYGRAVPLDPWGHRYQLVPDAVDGTPDARTLGADGLPGGTGPNADRTMASVVGALAPGGTWDVGT